VKISRIGLAIALLLGFSACSGRGETERPTEAFSSEVPEAKVVEPQGRFIHTVLFWLKEGTTEEQKQSLIQDCRTMLGSIETVRYLAAGVPAGTPRDVVDNSYGVGLVVHFDDTAGHELYQGAEAHLQFIERNEGIWERVQVYDFLVNQDASGR